MALPAPNLDDRRFQELVDDAKRMVQSRCPEWTDHNVSDPGITLIETFAYMTDQMLYRLNRVPDRLYIKFLELIGVQLLPPTPARAAVTFWLSTPATEHITIPTGTRTARCAPTSREPVIFATVEDLDIVPCVLEDLVTQASRERRPRASLRRPDGRHLVLRVSADAATGRHALVRVERTGAVVRGAAHVRCHVEGVGVDPTNPPLVWEALDGDGEWNVCEIERDEHRRPQPQRRGRGARPARRTRRA